MLERCGRGNLNIFHLKWIIGNHGNWKKSTSWGPFWRYQLNRTAIIAHLPQNWANLPNPQCCLAGSSQMAPRILIFSIAMGADYSFYAKTIETYARALFKVIIFSIGSVSYMSVVWKDFLNNLKFFVQHYGNSGCRVFKWSIQE